MWTLLVFYALAACVWTVWLWMTGLKAVPAAQGGVFSVMLPVSAALVGVLVLGESLTFWQWAAFAIALASMLLATLPSRTALRVGRRVNQAGCRQPMQWGAVAASAPVYTSHNRLTAGAAY